MKTMDAYLKGHGYGYSKARSSYLVSKGQRNTQLCYGYEVSMIEDYKEYSDSSLQEAFDQGAYRGRMVGYMTNLAEGGQCLGKEWTGWQKEIANFDKKRLSHAQ